MYRLTANITMSRKRIEFPTAENAVGVRIKVDANSSHKYSAESLFKAIADVALHTEWVDDSHNELYYYAEDTEDLEYLWKYPLEKQFAFKVCNVEKGIRLIDHIPNFKQKWDFITMPIGGSTDIYGDCN